MEQSDNDIIQEILRGGHHGYAILLQRYRARVLSLTLRMIGHRADAEEAAQDAFIRAFRALRGFEQRARFSTWLYRIAYNTAVTYRQRQRMVTLPLDEEHDDTDAARIPPDRNLEYEELRKQVQKALDHLRPEYATLVTLFYLQDQSYDEIATITGLPLGTVKNRLHRARMELRAYVLKNYPSLEPTH
ncbi:MAG: sigma-70 family RNA polymerase sigma factor [Bacteroidetes bacterium]|nr:sigma-70 family RNA polymerase sigma factor [Bacteroidota bacterium]